jgi:hypothetical protein
MKEMIQIFISAIKKRGHVLKLIEKLDGLKIKLVCEGKEEFLVFHRGEAILITDNKEKAAIYEICGQLNSINSLFEGKEKLRNLINNRQLKVKAPLRTILLLESIFYLTRTEAQVEKIIS